MRTINHQKETPGLAGQGATNHHVKNDLYEYGNSGFGLMQDKRPSLRAVLIALGVRYSEKKITSWQPVKCPICNHSKALALLYGQRGHSGGFTCDPCGTRGDALALYRRATSSGFREACSAFGAWGKVSHD